MVLQQDYWLGQPIVLLTEIADAFPRRYSYGLKEPIDNLSHFSFYGLIQPIESDRKMPKSTGIVISTHSLSLC